MANDTLTDTARAVEEKIETARETIGGRVKDRVSEVADNVKARAAQLREKIQTTEWDDVMTNVTSYVRDNPGKAVGIALGVGFVAGLLLRRRSDD